MLCNFFFFFQAEDGIRDHCVTGVQTCALPISLMRRSGGRKNGAAAKLLGLLEQGVSALLVGERCCAHQLVLWRRGVGRLFFRRVGHPCRAGWRGKVGTEREDHRSVSASAMVARTASAKPNWTSWPCGPSMYMKWAGPSSSTMIQASTSRRSCGLPALTTSIFSRAPGRRFLTTVLVRSVLRGT